jgi:hypothetical protein
VLFLIKQYLSCFIRPVGADAGASEELGKLVALSNGLRDGLRGG